MNSTHRSTITGSVLRTCLNLILGLCAAIVVLMAMRTAWSQPLSATQQAQAAVDAKYRTEALLVQGKGGGASIDSWTYYFYDPTAKNNIREVQIANGKAETVSSGDYHRSASSDLAFDPSATSVPVETALKTAQDYASRNQITYNQTRVLLRRPEAGQAPTWRVQLLQDGRSRGVVYTDGSGAYSKYAGADVKASVSGFGTDVKNTFLGVGGDMEEFFTGKRTVDQ
ncbi:MAG: hypothetical protein PW734_12060 [Verrucomicrobium sp.]|nr:hypothetical protein [Verrucomicrobium sp.]